MIKRTVPKKITAFFMTVLMAANTVHTVNASVAMGQISSEANVHNIGFTTVTEAEPTPDASFETETAKPIILDCSGKLPFQYNGVLVDIKDSTQLAFSPYKKIICVPVLIYVILVLIMSLRWFYII